MRCCKFSSRPNFDRLNDFVLILDCGEDFTCLDREYCVPSDFECGQLNL
jgi:hypothetical protein